MGFECTRSPPNNTSDGTKIKIEMAEHVSMDAVLEEFQNFLRAYGYVIEYNQCLVLENMDESNK